MAKLQGIIIVVLAIISATVSLGGKPVGALVRHVVGGDRGWDPASDIASWSSGKTFRVGDEIWFTYSVAQGLVAELQSKEEYESCIFTNPIKMYTDGLHTIPLEKEGIKYFASTDVENCKNGLKLHVDVLPTATENSTTTITTAAPKKGVADAPSSPSGSAHYGTSSILMLIVLMLYVTMGVAY
ncbi:mavicyanin [Neltuma alba]|uniref:mavicyanin n=1 Tax=Neltuma alba TaxID=207710 RepID=UPI0010A59D46|nr:mavicyanin-like [Prosopis alba]